MIASRKPQSQAPVGATVGLIEVDSAANLVTEQLVTDLRDLAEHDVQREGPLLAMFPV